MNIEIAKAFDLIELYSLINISYRDKLSWTRDSSLVGGIRIYKANLKKMLESDENIFLICKNNDQIVGNICLELKSNRSIHFSLFSICPEIQNKGFGSLLLIMAENFAENNMKVNKFVVQVLSPQIEIKGYYLRRGYKKTNTQYPYPAGKNVGMPFVKDLFIDHLEKYT